MKIKIFSLRCNADYRALWIADETRKISANEYLEREIQKFFDHRPKAEVKHIQYSSTQIIPTTAAWNTTNVDIDWEIEKCVIILFEDGA